MTKKLIIIGAVITLLIVTFFYFYKTQKTYLDTSKLDDNFEAKNIQVNNYEEQRDKAITEYLLSQKSLAWKTKPESTNFCVFEVLDKEQQLFPISLWVRCGEFEFQNNKTSELSGISAPILIDYPNELSYFNPQLFSHKLPRDGSLYLQDVKTIFPEYLQQTILKYDVTTINKQLIIKAETIAKK
jgi:hypothetical protein